MEFRQLGGSGFKVPFLSLGTGTFGGGNDFFKAWGSTDSAGASRLIDVCLDHGLSMFATADGEQIFVGLTSNGHWQRFCEKFARRDLLDDPDYQTNEDRVRTRAALRPRR